MPDCGKRGVGVRAGSDAGNVQAKPIDTLLYWLLIVVGVCWTLEPGEEPLILQLVVVPLTVVATSKSQSA